jgi:hypothetical protein
LARGRSWANWGSSRRQKKKEKLLCKSMATSPGLYEMTVMCPAVLYKVPSQSSSPSFISGLGENKAE